MVYVVRLHQFEDDLTCSIVAGRDGLSGLQADCEGGDNVNYLFWCEVCSHDTLRLIVIDDDSIHHYTYVVKSLVY